MADILSASWDGSIPQLQKQGIILLIKFLNLFLDYPMLCWHQQVAVQMWRV